MDDIEILGDTTSININSIPQDPTNEDSFIGTTLSDRYEILKLIGKGGMGRVYKAYQRTVDRTVAIKILKAALATQPTLVKRFRQEARASSRLSHPNTITIHDFGQANDSTLFIVMEYLKGYPLSRLLKQSPSPQQVLKIMIQVCDSLAEAHQHGIVHRDLKPGNILLCRIGNTPDYVKVLDFGIAKIGTTNTEITNGGQIMGTPKYMSPELIDGCEVDCRADIYSLGIIMYELLSGGPIFVVDSPLAYFTKHLNEIPRPLCEIETRHPIPPMLSDIVSQMLMKDRNKRIQQISDVVPMFIEILQQQYELRITRGAPHQHFVHRSSTAPKDDTPTQTNFSSNHPSQTDENSILTSLAELYEKNKEFSKASHVYTKLGESHINVENYEAALPLLEKAVNTNKTNIKATSLLAGSHIRLGRTKNAIPLYKGLIRLYEKTNDRENTVATLTELAAAYSVIDNHHLAKIIQQRIDKLKKHLNASSPKVEIAPASIEPTPSNTHIQKQPKETSMDSIIPSIEPIAVHLENATRLIGDEQFQEALAAVRKALIIEPENESAYRIANEILSIGRRGLSPDERIWLKILLGKKSVSSETTALNDKKITNEHVKENVNETVFSKSVDLESPIHTLIESNDLVIVKSGIIRSVLTKEPVSIASFAIGRAPITNAQYAEFVEATGEIPPGEWCGFRPPKEKELHPVVGITLSQATRFAHWKKLRLPTVLEWEYAARGDDGRRFPWGDDFNPQNCHCKENGATDTCRVTLFEHTSSPVGCIDMVGNVWEWTLPDSCAKQPDEDYAWVRGGSFKHPCTKDNHIAWTSVSKESTYRYLGFRVAVDLEQS